MKTILISLAILALSPTVRSEQLFCKVMVNGQIDSKSELSVEPHSSISFGELSDYRIKINNKGNDNFELEIFDPSWPSRNYAFGKLRLPEDEVRWSFWSRDILLEASCSLIQKK